MNYLDIFCFTSVARTKSFSITARELLISQQAVSRHVKVLEDEVGCPLFLRNFQSVYLTEAGELLLKYCMEWNGLMAEYQKDSPPDRTHKTFRVGLSQWIGCPDWFQRVIDAFSARHSDVDLFVYDLTADEIRDYLEREQLDALLTTRYAASRLPIAWRVSVLREEPLFLVGNSRLEYDMNSLSGCPFAAAYAGESDELGVRARHRALCQDIGIRCGPVDVLPDMGSVCMSVLLKGALTLVPGNSTMDENPDYMMTPAGRSATCVLCTPFQTDNDCLREFIRMAATDGVII